MTLDYVLKIQFRVRIIFNLGQKIVTALLIFIAFLLCCSICIAFYCLIIFNLKFERRPSTSFQEPISVIISARNESSNLKRFLPHILKQDYDNFEVIIINHGCEDATEQLINEYSNGKSDLKIINLSTEEFPSKKHALAKGIESSKNEILLFTDADCIPKSEKWLITTNELIQGVDMLLGYGKYARTNSFLNKLIRYDTFHSSVMYFLFAKLGWAYMGVGRNLAYRKNLFQTVGGFESHKSVLSGDDDLFIQEATNIGEINICLDPLHHTISIPADTWKKFFIQKRRHQTAGYNYKPIYLIVLFGLAFSFFGFWLFFVIGIFLSEFIPLLILLFGLKMIFQYFSYWKISKTLGEKDLLSASPILELIVVLYNGLVGLSLLISKQAKWK